MVLDASALVELLLDTLGLRARVLEMVSGRRLHAPELAGPEVVETIRRLERRGEITSEQAHDAFDGFRGLSLRRWPCAPREPRAFDLRWDLSIYDGIYVALAEALDVPLLTADRRIARAPGPTCEVRLASE